jgi:hypothetical protein
MVAELVEAELREIGGHRVLLSSGLRLGRVSTIVRHRTPSS